MSKDQTRRRFNQETIEIRKEFRNVRAMLRDAEMYQTSRGKGNHVATITEASETSWSIEFYTTHPLYQPSQEQLRNTICDIVNEASSGTLACEIDSDSEIYVIPSEF